MMDHDAAEDFLDAIELMSPKDYVRLRLYLTCQCRMHQRLVRLVLRAVLDQDADWRVRERLRLLRLLEYPALGPASDRPRERPGVLSGQFKKLDDLSAPMPGLSFIPWPSTGGVRNDTMAEVAPQNYWPGTYNEGQSSYAIDSERRLSERPPQPTPADQQRAQQRQQGARERLRRYWSAWVGLRTQLLEPSFVKAFVLYRVSLGDARTGEIGIGEDQWQKIDARADDIIAKALPKMAQAIEQHLDLPLLVSYRHYWQRAEVFGAVPPAAAAPVRCPHPGDRQAHLLAGPRAAAGDGPHQQSRG